MKYFNMKIRILVLFVIFLFAPTCITNEPDKCLALLTLERRDLDDCKLQLYLSAYMYARGNPNKPGDPYYNPNYDPSQSPWHNIALYTCLDAYVSTRECKKKSQFSPAIKQNY